MFKRSASKCMANEAQGLSPSPPKPATNHSESRNLLSYQPSQTKRSHYLQMPIKIEPASSLLSKLRKQSQSFSEEVHSLLSQNHNIQEEPKPIKNEPNFNYPSTKEDVLLLENQLKVFNLADQGIIPMEPENAQKIIDEKEHHLQAVDNEPVLNEELFSISNNNGQINPVDRLLLALINDYQAYDQSLKIAVNFHSLQKRDYLTRMFGNIIGVITRENKKMENGLIHQLKKAGFGSKRQVPPSPIPNFRVMEEEISPMHPIPPRKSLFKSTPSSNKPRTRLSESKKNDSEIFYQDE